MSGSVPLNRKPGVYIAYFDIGTAGLEKPVYGDTIWVQLPFDEPGAGPIWKRDNVPAIILNNRKLEVERESHENCPENSNRVTTKEEEGQDDKNIKEEPQEHDEYRSELAYKEEYDIDPEDLNKESLNL